ncbi:MAG: DUF3581 family protein [Pseudomonadales bacterium]|nr:DUF3581 family protein [Pseudomonadales bacterium]
MFSDTFLAAFYQKNAGSITVSAEQASSFAKDIANDFNPIHNPEHKRFCVPGDLLFALSLGQYGLREKMSFSFEGMVGKAVNLKFPESTDTGFELYDDNDKHYLNVSVEGKTHHGDADIEAFIRSYVAFSGLNFLEVLVPLMAEHQMMINPVRPLVIYDSMSFELESFDIGTPELVLDKTEFDINGKRGDLKLYFDILNNGNKVGTGFKTLILSGLRPFNQEQMDSLVAGYVATQQAA